MLHELAAARSDREVWWIHGARGPREHPLAAEAHDLLASLPHAHEQRVLQQATAAELRPRPRRARPPHGRRAGRARRPGRRRRLRLRPGLVHDRHAATPSPRSASSRAASTPSCSGRCRRSTPASPARPPGHRTSRPGPPGPGRWSPSPAAASPRPFPAGARSVLDLADACDVPTRWSCRTGVCHTCITPLLSGDITYSPDPLEPPPDGEVLICCARPEHRRRPGHVAGPRVETGLSWPPSGGPGPGRCRSGRDRRPADHHRWPVAARCARYRWSGSGCGR